MCLRPHQSISVGFRSGSGSSLNPPRKLSAHHPAASVLDLKVWNRGQRAVVTVTWSPGPDAARPSQLSLELRPALRTVRPDEFCSSLSDIKMGGILVWQIRKIHEDAGSGQQLGMVRATRCAVPCFMAGCA